MLIVTVQMEVMMKELKKILERAVEELHKRGFQKVLLWVLEENARARHFYEKHGFVCSGDAREDEIGGKIVREARYIHSF